MNVYVRELAAALARSGVMCDVFTRAWSPHLAAVVEVEPGLRVHHVPAGPSGPVPKESLHGVVDEFTEGVLERMTADDEPHAGLPYTSVHANYWLSGLSGHVIKHELELPLVCTFHTLDRVKAESIPEEVEADLPHRRAEAEAAIIGCSDAVLASCTVEAEQIASLYGGDRGRIRVRRARSRPCLLRTGPPSPGAPCPRPPHRRSPAPLRGPYPAAQVCGRGRRDLGRAPTRRAPDLPACGRGRPERTTRREGARASPRPGRCQRAARSGGVRRPPAPRASLVVLPGCRRVHRAQPVRVVRAGGTGGVGLRHPGGRIRRRRSHHPGRPRAHGVLGGPRWLAVLRRCGAPRLCRALGRRTALDRLGVAGAPLHLARAARTLVELHDELAASRLVECR